ncbi:hypothetical protein Q3G72_001266 [Acer saccharum]|nr:hypothetical protein Q3G72_001266 [Acer saccharum]
MENWVVWEDFLRPRARTFTALETSKAVAKTTSYPVLVDSGVGAKMVFSAIPRGELGKQKMLEGGSLNKGKEVVEPSVVSGGNFPNAVGRVSLQNQGGWKRRARESGLREGGNLPNEQRLGDKRIFSGAVVEGLESRWC